jgi:hypothetical protein
MARSSHAALASTALILLLTTPRLSIADNTEVQYGTYVCITDRTVEIQSSKDSNERYAGAIKVGPERERFFITIHEITQADSVFETQKDGWSLHNPRTCKGMLEHYEAEWKEHGTFLFGADICFAKSELHVKTGSRE